MGSLERDSGVLHPLRSLYDLVLRECDEHGDASIAAAAEQGVTIPGGGVGVLWQPVVVDSESESDVCRGLVLSAGSDGKLVFLDRRSAARGESAGLPGALRRLAAARSPAEEGTMLSSKPTTILGGEGDGGDDAGEPASSLPAAAKAASSSPELPPQGVRGGVGAPLPETLGSISGDSARVSSQTKKKSLRLFLGETTKKRKENRESDERPRPRLLEGEDRK